MALFPELPRVGDVGRRAERAFWTPVGAASPLWIAFGAAASAGIAYWWLKQLTQAVNVEALYGLAAPLKTPMAPVLTRPEPVVAPAAVAEAVAEAPPAIDPEPIAAKPEPDPVAAVAAPEPEPIIEPEPEPVLLPADDLTRMSGIGPKLSEALAARGVTRFAQIAAWTAGDVGEIDKALSLKGRAVREAWVAQAKRLAGAN